MALTQKSIDNWRGKENVVHMADRMPFLKSKIQTFTAKWIKLEIVKWNKPDMERQTSHVLSHVKAFLKTKLIQLQNSGYYWLGIVGEEQIDYGPRKRNQQNFPSSLKIK